MAPSSDLGNRPLRRGRSTAAVHHDRSARLAAADRRIGWVTHVLDDLVTVPGTSRRVGLEPIVGLIPGAGDLVSAAVGRPRDVTGGWSMRTRLFGLLIIGAALLLPGSPAVAHTPQYRFRRARSSTVGLSNSTERMPARSVASGVQAGQADS